MSFGDPYGRRRPFGPEPSWREHLVVVRPLPMRSILAGLPCLKKGCGCSRQTRASGWSDWDPPTLSPHQENGKKKYGIICFFEMTIFKGWKLGDVVELVAMWHVRGCWSEMVRRENQEGFSREAQPPRPTWLAMACRGIVQRASVWYFGRNPGLVLPGAAGTSTR